MLNFLIFILLIPSFSFARTSGELMGGGLWRFLISVQPSRQPQQLSRPSQPALEPRKKIEPVPHPKDISRSELEDKIKKSIDEVNEQIPLLQEGIDKAKNDRAKTLPAILEYLKKLANEQLILLKKLYSDFDRLSEKDIKTQLTPIRNNVAAMLIEKGDKIIDPKTGKELVAIKAGPIAAARQEMRDLIDRGWVKDPKKIKDLELKIKELDQSRDNLIDKVNEMNNTLHPKSRITP